MGSMKKRMFYEEVDGLKSIGTPGLEHDELMSLHTAMCHDLFI